MKGNDMKAFSAIIFGGLLFVTVIGSRANGQDPSPRIETKSKTMDEQYLDSELRDFKAAMWEQQRFWITVELGVLAVFASLFIFAVPYAGAKIYSIGLARGTEMAIKRNGAVLDDLKKDCESHVQECKKKATEATRLAYDGAMSSIQWMNSYVDTKVGDNLNDRSRKALREIEIAGARLQIALGGDHDVVAGVNKLYRYAEFGDAIRHLRQGLNRNDLTEEARKTIQDRIDEILQAHMPSLMENVRLRKASTQ
jgi:hypothetical protein